MSLPRVVLDNSAVMPAYFRESPSPLYDAGAVTNRSRALVQAVRARRVNAFVPPSFYREFLNVAVKTLDKRGGRTSAAVELVRGHWQDVLSLPLIVGDATKLAHDSGGLSLDDGCPAADSWYLAAAREADATLWMSHRHNDGFAAVASRFVDVRVLSEEAPSY